MSNTRTNIALPDSLRAYVAKRVESGAYGSAGEYVEDMICKDQREQCILRLRAIVSEGLQSGPATADTEADWDDLRAIARGDIA